MGAALGGIAGAFLASYLTTVNPSQFTFSFSIFILAMVVLGGLGSVKGTLLGALLLGVVESVGAAFFGDGYRDFIGFAAFLVVLSLRPQGLFGRVRPA
jgi:ABC-type branched-subunit amino acid transport system permease subunit